MARVACVERAVPTSVPVPTVVDVAIRIWPPKEMAFSKAFSESFKYLQVSYLIKTLRPFLNFFLPELVR